MLRRPQHACRAGWSVTVRRLSELLAAPVPLLAVLRCRSSCRSCWARGRCTAGPIRTRPPATSCSPHKAPYFNPVFFAARSAGYFLVWWLLARYFLLRSVEQDRSGDARLTLRMERLSGPALLLFFVTVTFASFDWLMSLDPWWSSTIFGVYYFSGAVVGFLAAVILLALLLQSAGRLTASVTVEHYHDLGKLLFAFVIFWGYIAFSQYLLIWYGNIPEETSWYLVRQTGGWAAVSLLAVVGAPADAVFRAVVAGSEATEAVVGFLGRLDARGPLDRRVLAGDAQRVAGRAAAGAAGLRLPGRNWLPVPGRGVPCRRRPRVAAAGRSPAGRILGL